MSGIDEQERISFDDVWPAIEEKLKREARENIWSNAKYMHYRKKARLELEIALEIEI